MITITYGSREPPSLTIRGHSGYATQGTDIVCAAVSALFVTLSNSLTEYTNDLVSVRSEPGDSAIIWRGLTSARGRLLLESALLGMKGVAEAYPEHVEFKIE